MKRTVDGGPLLQGIGGLLLVLSLFLDWYEPGLSGFEAFEIIDLLLLGLGLASMALAAGRDEGTLGRRAALIAGAALVLVVSQLVQHPPASLGADPDTGAWLGLAGAIAMGAGAALTVARFSVRIDVAGRDRRARVAAEDERAAAAEAATASAGPGSVAVDTQSTQSLEPVEREEPGGPAPGI